MTINEAASDLARMKQQLSARDAKYRRNYNRYANNGVIQSNIRDQYGYPLGLRVVASEADAGLVPVVNAQRSCIDAIVSKLSQTRVRPFFNPVNGTYKTRKICRSAQQFFDLYFDQAHIYTLGIECMRDSKVFDLGLAWIDDDSRKVKRIMPWEFYYDQAEINFGEVTRVGIGFEQYPLRAIPEEVKTKLAKDRIGPGVFGTYEIYYDLYDGKKHYFVDGNGVHTKPIEFNVAPIVLLWSSPPVLGGKTTSLIDDTITLQYQLDDLVERVHIASVLSPANTIFVPDGSNIKPSMVSNQIGQIMEYRPSPDAGGGQVMVSTPRFIDPEYLQLMQYVENKIYEMQGISQLSAQAKKPAGLDSGKALETLEDVESDRHNVPLQAIIKFYMDIANAVIEIFPEDEEIMPSAPGGVKWKDIKKQKAMFRVQFSATSALSKDPKTKLEQIRGLMDMGLLNGPSVARLLEMPDLEDAYSILTAAFDDVERIIDRVVTDGTMDFYEAVPLDLLLQQSVNTLLRLDANDESREVLERLSEFIKLVYAKEQAVKAPPPAPPQAIQGEQAPAQAGAPQ